MWDSLIVQVTTIGFIFYLSLALLEIAADLYRKTGHYMLKDTLCSLAMSAFYLGNKIVMKGTTLVLLYLAAQFSLTDWGLGWWQLAICYVIVDFFFYWLHRMIHEVRFAWAAHVNHHSSQEFNLGGTALRQSFAEPFLEAFFYSPIVLLGFDPLLVLLALEINLIYMFWLHTRSIDKLPAWYEYIFSTPSHHRVHHGSNVQYLDKNYGGTFIFWDRMFGSYEKEVEPVKFGIPEQINTFNPIKASLHGWISLFKDVWGMPGLVNKAGLLIMPPGWLPDGKGSTARQRQAAYRESSSE